MDIITLFYRRNVVITRYAISEWYSKPSIFQSLASFFKNKNDDFLFLTSEKYGCRQFLPCDSKGFHVHNIHTISYKDTLDWLVIEFK